MDGQRTHLDLELMDRELKAVVMMAVFLVLLAVWAGLTDDD